MKINYIFSKENLQKLWETYKRFFGLQIGSITWRNRVPAKEIPKVTNRN